MNIDKLKQELIEFKKILSDNLLTEEENKEINIFIEGLVKDIEEKTKKIDVEKLSSSLEKYFKEN